MKCSIDFNTSAKTNQMEKIFNIGEVPQEDIEQFPILLKLKDKLHIFNLDSIYFAYCSARICDRLYMHDAAQFSKIGVPLFSLLDREQISNGKINFQDLYQSLEKFLSE